jgi:cyclopropane-fatty-acyl-phospholipid synthase
MMAAPGSFGLESVEDFGHRECLNLCVFLCSSHVSVLDYPRTLREWGRCVNILEYHFYSPPRRNTRRLQKNWDNTACALIKARPELSQGDNLGILKRKWEYMYMYAEIGFARAYTSMHIFTFVRPVSATTYLFL